MDEIAEWAERVKGNIEDYIIEGRINDVYDLIDVLKQYRDGCTEEQHDRMCRIVVKWYEERGES